MEDAAAAVFTMTMISQIWKVWSLHWRMAMIGISIQVSPFHPLLLQLPATTSINVGTSSTTVPAIATMTTPALPVAFSPTSVSTAIVAGTTTQLAAGGAVAASSTLGTTNLAPQNVQSNQGHRLRREDAFICSSSQLRSAKSWSDLYAA